MADEEQQSTVSRFEVMAERARPLCEAMGLENSIFPVAEVHVHPAEGPNYVVAYSQGRIIHMDFSPGVLDRHDIDMKRGVGEITYFDTKQKFDYAFFAELGRERLCRRAEGCTHRRSRAGKRKLCGSMPVVCGRP